MVYELLKDAVRRHLDETMPLIEQLRDVDIMSKPISEGREIGEVVLHLIRSLEYYMRGIVESFWEPLPYTLETYNSSEAIIQLADQVFKRVSEYMYFVRLVNFNERIDSFNRPATIAEIILEMIEHSIHHRGQLTVYYRLLGITPEQISYII
ncbi:MAG: DinB family protein [Candidatus Thorarchaeota archaeon]